MQTKVLQKVFHILLLIASLQIPKGSFCTFLEDHQSYLSEPGDMSVGRELAFLYCSHGSILWRIQARPFLFELKM